jgi:hypothetical protein
MRLKRMATAAAIAASVGMAGLSIAVVPAYADQPPCNQPNCQGGPGPHGPSGPPQQGPGGPPQHEPSGPPQQGPSGPPPNNAPNNAPDNGQRDFNGNGPQQQGPPQQGPQNQGGPRDTPGGWRSPGQGAPPPPQAGRDGWNDGPPPGGPPRDWDGPPPPGGWNGPPPPGGWNRHWDGPQRDIDQARFDHQPFDYNDYQAVPIWSPDQGGWGFWFFGLWIPL